MAFEENTLLFGSDPAKRIVAIELGETGTVKVYRREKDGSTSVDIEPFRPFVWCDSDVTDLNIDAEKLAGDLRYGWRISVNTNSLPSPLGTTRMGLWMVTPGSSVTS